jgi:hypothetical protein
MKAVYETITLALIVFQVTVAIAVFKRTDLVVGALLAAAIFSGLAAPVSSPGGTVGNLVLAAVQTVLAVVR